MIRFKACPRCKGDCALDMDDNWVCQQCGRVQEWGPLASVRNHRLASEPPMGKMPKAKHRGADEWQN